MKKKRRLVLIRPGEHEKGKKLAKEVYEAIQSRLREIKKTKLGNSFREAVIHYAPTKCALQTAFIAAGVLDCHMPSVADALKRRAEPGQILMQLTNFLYLNGAANLQVVIMPFDIDQSLFEALLKMLNEELRWEINHEQSALLDGALVIEYVK